MKYVFTLIASVFILSCYSQEKLTGIGSIKIGKTLAELKEMGVIADLIDANIADPSDLVDIKNNYLLVFDSLKRPDDLILFMYERCVSAKVVLMKDYKVSGINTGQLKLTFYKDSLVEIYFFEFSPELAEAIKTKYGDGKLESKTEKVKCKSVYGEVVYEDRSFTTYWNKGETIEAINKLSVYRDAKCKKQSSNEFYIHNRTGISRVKECSARFTKIDDKNKKSDDKKKLIDF